MRAAEHAAMPCRSRLLACCAAAILGGARLEAAPPSAPPPPCPSPLRVGFLDVDLRPFVLGQGARFATPPGTLVEAVQRTLQAQACPVQLSRWPARRMVQALNAGELDVAIGLAPSDERLRLLRFPVDAQGRLDERWAMAETAIRLYATAQRHAAVLTQWAQQGPAALRYGALRGSVYAEALAAEGLRVELTPDFAKGWTMLHRGRFDVVVVPDLLAAEGGAVRAVGPTLFQLHYFAPVNRQFAAANEAWVRQFWQRLCSHTRPHFKGLQACPEGEPH